MEKRISPKSFALALFATLVLVSGLSLFPSALLTEATSSSRSLILHQGMNLLSSFAPAPFASYQPLSSIEGASPGAYVDVSFYHSSNDCSLAFGADGSGYWCREYVGENAQDWGLVSFNVHQLSKVTLGYSITEQVTSGWRFDFASEKNGGGSLASFSFTPVPSTKQTIELDLRTLALSFVSESFSFYYKLDSIYSLFFYLNDLRLDYLC